ncbi:MAG: hypothetical protein AAGB24_15665 [Bacteroidota bacterium]
MSAFQQHLIAPIFNLKITEDLEEGIPIGQNIYLTNNEECKSTMLTDSLRLNIGIIEASAFESCHCFFYSAGFTKNEEKGRSFIEDHKITLLQFLFECEHFLSKLWFLKDHACNIELSYLEIFKYLSATHANSIFGSTNFLGRVNVFADGQTKEISISEEELKHIVKKYAGLRPRQYVETFDKAHFTFIYKTQTRVEMALSFLYDARGEHNLGIKISNYCSLFESLFSTGNGELIHKLSERTACFIAHTPEKKYEIFRKVKDIYAIRSQVVHGSNISKRKHTRLGEYAVEADHIARSVFKKIFSDEVLFKTIDGLIKNEKLGDFYDKMVLGF